MSGFEQLFPGKLPRLVMFDLDGTLIDSVPDLAAAVDEMLLKLGRKPAGIESVREWVGNGVQMLVRRALANHIDAEGVDDVEAEHAQEACVAVLGMGNDGHTASLFPGSADLDRALASPLPYAALDASGCPVAGDWPLRITLTPAGLARTRHRLLLLRGETKREVFLRALQGDDVRELPIRAALGIGLEPVRVHWCE